jgi:hypothetical protein
VIKEKDIQNEILEYLQEHRIGSFERVNNTPAYSVKFGGYLRPSKYSKKGMCDIIGCISGRFIGIEVKTPSEFKYVNKLYNKISKNITNYKPISKKEEHVISQMRYIFEKNQNGALCFFADSVSRVEKILIKGGLINE